MKNLLIGLWYAAWILIVLCFVTGFLFWGAFPLDSKFYNVGCVMLQVSCGTGFVLLWAYLTWLYYFKPKDVKK